MAKSGKKVSFDETIDHPGVDSEDNSSAPVSDVDDNEENDSTGTFREQSHEDDGKTELPSAKPKPSARPLNPSQMQLIKQKHLQKQSVKVIESLLEAVIDQAYLRKSLALLCKSEMDDLVTERHLISICGYPLCAKTLTEPFNRKQKFKIDFKNRVLHNYEDRIKYCSNLCMKSTEFLTSQMPDEPLWMRYKDSTGYDGLYEKSDHIKFYHERNETEKQEPLSAVTRAMERLKVRQVNRSDFVTLPYIKDEHMEELKKSLFTLEIRERSSVDDGDT